MDVAEIGHCLRDRVPDFTAKLFEVGESLALASLLPLKQ